MECNYFMAMQHDDRTEQHKVSWTEVFLAMEGGPFQVQGLFLVGKCRGSSDLWRTLCFPSQNSFQQLEFLPFLLLFDASNSLVNSRWTIFPLTFLDDLSSCLFRTGSCFAVLVCGTKEDMLLPPPQPPLMGELEPVQQIAATVLWRVLWFFHHSWSLAV